MSKRKVALAVIMLLSMVVVYQAMAQVAMQQDAVAIQQVANEDDTLVVVWSSGDPDVEFDLNRQERADEIPETLGQIRNREEGRTTRLERFPELGDFYNENDEYTVTNADRNKYASMIEGLEDWERAALERAVSEDDYVYFVDFENIGGLVSPLPLLVTDVDGNEEFLMIPAEIWRKNHLNVSKMLIRDKAIASIAVDPRRETADANFSNNHVPARVEKSRLELFKREDESTDMMADMLRTLRKSGDDDSEKEVPLEAVENP